jgi:hypothetical protein
MSGTIANGTFVITDVTGYTAFLTDSELEHGRDILSNLLDAIVAAIEPPLVVSNFQGDAVLSYAPDHEGLRGQTFLETIDRLYGSFAAARTRIQQNTSCDCCRACKNVGALDLKVFVHHGAFATQRIQGREELSGRDLIVAHRMMKNSLRERTGLSAYALISGAAIRALGLEPFAADMIAHQETYEHLGEVPMFAMDLRTPWEESQSRRRVHVSALEAWADFEVELPVPPQAAWELLTVAEHRMRWAGADEIAFSSRHRGRIGVGTTVRCARGRRLSDFAVLDWRPFEYFTEERPLRLGARAICTTELVPTENATRVAWRVARPNGPSTVAALAGVLGAASVRRGLRHAGRELQRLAATVHDKHRGVAP